MGKQLPGHYLHGKAAFTQEQFKNVKAPKKHPQPGKAGGTIKDGIHHSGLIVSEECICYTVLGD